MCFFVVEYLQPLVEDETRVYEIASQSSIFEFIIKNVVMNGSLFGPLII